eukprot:TRINITY_DN3769_c0_g1_i2.p1 TRINITY_DN3769_c0_g1~~TRINITY_DN3769_c0_g1_i2.p1  ORF type:complete len:375 (+),score=109.26 TRINITY_DN3769_c0_g1_i2:535-1659(+)
MSLTLAFRRSLPNIASILTGAGPMEHGVLDNDWTLRDAELAPISGACSPFPTFFSSILRSDPGAYTAAFVSSASVASLIPEKLSNRVVGQCSQFEDCAEVDLTTAAEAQKVFLRHNYTSAMASLVYLSQIEAAARLAYDQPQYAEAVTRVDGLIDALYRSFFRHPEDPTDGVFIVVSDHGGCWKSDHVSPRWSAPVPSSASSHSFFAAVGKTQDAQIPRGSKIQRHASLIDVATTALFALGFEQPSIARGQIIHEVFSEHPPGYEYVAPLTNESVCVSEIENCDNVVIYALKLVFSPVYLMGFASGFVSLLLVVIVIAIFNCISSFFGGGQSSSSQAGQSPSSTMDSYDIEMSDMQRRSGGRRSPSDKYVHLDD